MALLEVRNLKKIYMSRFSNHQVVALKNVSFQVEQGEFLAIMGESGSGKTTLLNLLAALDRPSAGEILIRGRSLLDIGSQELAAFRRERLGFIFQDFHLLDSFSLRDNIFLPLVLSRKKPDEMRQRLEPLARLLQITPILDQYPVEVSGGQKQRAAVARALITHPDLILADEPTGALDSRTADQLMAMLDTINQQGQTIVLVTHSIKAASAAKRVLFLQDGEVVLKLNNEQLSFEQRLERISAVQSELSVRRDQYVCA